MLSITLVIESTTKNKTLTYGYVYRCALSSNFHGINVESSLLTETYAKGKL